jgi:hypothetical protein
MSSGVPVNDRPVALFPHGFLQVFYPSGTHTQFLRCLFYRAGPVDSALDHRQSSKLKFWDKLHIEENSALTA